MKLICFAKINLFLDVISRRRDGYHNIQSAMQTIDLKDEIEITKKTKGFSIECTHPHVPLDETNIVYKIFAEVKNTYRITQGAHIKIEKNIPVFSGLGGGSSDGAAVLMGLNSIWGLDMSIDEMIHMGGKIGADIPFFLLGGTVLAEGKGEKLTKINNFVWENILIVKPEINISTKEIYTSVNPQDFGKYDSRTILKLIEDNDYGLVPKYLYNLLEKVSEQKHSEIKKIKEKAIEMGAVASLMSGSGSSVFAFFKKENTLMECNEFFRHKGYFTIKTKTVEEGIRYV